MLFLETFCKNRKKCFFDTGIYKEGFTCIAHAYSLCLCIHDNIHCHVQICTLVYINMTISRSCLNDRNRTLVDNRFDQSLTASWDKYIYILVHLHEFGCCLSGCILDQLDRVLCHTICLQCFTNTFYDCFIRMNRVTAALQDHNITGLKAKTKRICRYIRTCLINDSDDTERNSFLSDQETIRTFFHSCHFPDRVFQCHKLLQSLCHPLDSFRCKEKSVNKSFRHIVLFAILNICCICSDKLFCAFHQMLCNCSKYLILFVCGYGTQSIFCFLRILSKL